jgi:hypothetical protein
MNKELFDWLKALYLIWARHLNPEFFRTGVRLTTNGSTKDLVRGLAG